MKLIFLKKTLIKGVCQICSRGRKLISCKVLSKDQSIFKLPPRISQIRSISTIADPQAFVTASERRTEAFISSLEQSTCTGKNWSSKSFERTQLCFSETKRYLALNLTTTFSFFIPIKDFSIEGSKNSTLYSRVPFWLDLAVKLKLILYTSEVS